MIKRCLYYLAALLIVLAVFCVLCFIYNENINAFITNDINDVKAERLFFNLGVDKAYSYDTRNLKDTKVFNDTVDYL